MSYSQKKQYRNNPGKGKAVEADRWDHGGFDQLQSELEQTPYNEDYSNRFRKSNKYYQDTALSSNPVESARSDSSAIDINKKWTHV
mgnify:FL=1|jgi:hypothetical protein